MKRQSDIPLPVPLDEDRPAGGGLLTQLRVSVVATVVLALIVCGLYPAIVWGLSQALFRHQADGSLIDKDGYPTTDDSKAVGSALLGQPFADAKYFHPRPSAAGTGYDATASGGSNLGPTSAKLMFGTTKNFGYTVFASDKSPAAVVPVAGRVQGTVVEVTKTTITVTPTGAAPGAKTQYALDAAVADPATTVGFHGRTVHATTIAVGATVELKLNDKAPSAVTAINVADQEIDGGVSLVDTGGNKITLNDSGSTVITVDPKATAFVVNGKADAKLDAVKPGMALHAVLAAQMDFDGVADRVIHYCQDNKIEYKSSVPDSAFTDADGVDDEKLVAAFNAATSPTIEPDAGKGTPDGAKGLPADAVTASASGLDPHVSPRNAWLQAQRVADARGKPVEFVRGLIEQFTEPPQLGVFGDPRVNVLRLNLELDRVAPAPAAAPTTTPATAPATAPTTGPSATTAPTTAP